MPKQIIEDWVPQDDLSRNVSTREPTLDIAIVTLFPDLFEAFLDTSFLGRARREGLIRIHLEQLRNHGLGVHRSVDDTPYGGGAGMVMRVDCVVSAIEIAEASCKFHPKAYRILLSPQGCRLTQQTALRWVRTKNLLFVCGRYEGFDERVCEFVDEESSLGDFILMGGEVAAMAALETCARLINGVLGNDSSASDESFSERRLGMLEYPQYTRPVDFRGHSVPEVLRSGDHKKIHDWREKSSLERTRKRRPDLVTSAARGDKP